MKTLLVLVVGAAVAFSNPLNAQTNPPPAGQPTIAPAQQPTLTAPPRRAQSKHGVPAEKQQKRAQRNDTGQNPVPARPHQNPKANSERQAHRPAITYVDAVKRQHHQRHDRHWWTSRYTTIVFVTGQGYYYWDTGYWFPAWGYDPRYETYDYDGPIYTYGELLPDQVIYNVQRALKELGYYAGALTGSLGQATLAAIAAFQEDNGLDVTGAIDAPTVEALGLY